MKRTTMKQASVHVVLKTKDYYSNFDSIFRKDSEKNTDHADVCTCSDNEEQIDAENKK